MKKTNKTMKRVVAGCLVLGILASVGIGAYLTDTETKTDVYTVGNVQAEIVSNGDMEVANAGYLLPGTTHVYERAASNVGINDAYIFMSLTIPYEMIGVADDDGTQLGEKVMQLFTPGTINSEWKLVDDGFIGEYEITANGQAAGEHDAYSVIAGDTITYVYGYVGDNADGTLKALASGETTSNLLEELKLTNLYNASKIDGEVSTKLYAIQSNHVNGGLTDVNGVWAVINTALVGGESIQEPESQIANATFNLSLSEEQDFGYFTMGPDQYNVYIDDDFIGWARFNNELYVDSATSVSGLSTGEHELVVKAFFYDDNGNTYETVCYSETLNFVAGDNTFRIDIREIPVPETQQFDLDLVRFYEVKTSSNERYEIMDNNAVAFKVQNLTMMGDKAVFRCSIENKNDVDAIIEIEISADSYDQNKFFVSTDVRDTTITIPARSGVADVEVTVLLMETLTDPDMCILELRFNAFPAN